MIVIKDLDFEMEQIKSTPFFNLKLPTIVNEGKDNERTELKIDGYGMPFESCIQRIVSLKLAKLDKTYTVAQYVNVYAKMVDELYDKVSYIEKASKKDEEENEVELENDED